MWEHAVTPDELAAGTLDEDASLAFGCTHMQSTPCNTVRSDELPLTLGLCLKACRMRVRSEWEVPP